MHKRNLMRMTTEKHRKGPIPTDVNISLFGDAGWTEGVAQSLHAKPRTSKRWGSEAANQHSARPRQSCSKVQRAKCSCGYSAELCHELSELRVKAHVEGMGARRLRIPGLKAQHEFVNRDEVCGSNAKQPRREKFASERRQREWQFRRRGCGCHLADTRLLRRSAIETRDPVTKSSLRRGRLIRS